MIIYFLIFLNSLVSKYNLNDNSNKFRFFIVSLVINYFNIELGFEVTQLGKKLIVLGFVVIQEGKKLLVGCRIVTAVLAFVLRLVVA